MPGKRLCKASAIRWEEECQNVCLASWSSHLCNLIVQSSLIGLSKSNTLSFTLTARTSCANLELMPWAISKPVTPLLYWRTLPSGNVTLIISYIYNLQRAYNTRMVYFPITNYKGINFYYLCSHKQPYISTIYKHYQIWSRKTNGAVPQWTASTFHW